MWLLREKLSDFRVKHLTSGWLICSPKKLQLSSIIFKSHNASWWQQIWPGKQIRPNLLRSISLYNTSEVKQYYEALYLSYRPRTECSISLFFKTNCTQSIFRTINRWLLAKPFKKFPKSPIRPAGSHFWQAPNFQWTLKELRFNIIKNLLCLFFLFNGFITMCNLKKRLIRAAFWVLLQAMFTERLKTNGTAIKITRETTNNQ